MMTGLFSRIDFSACISVCFPILNKSMYDFSASIPYFHYISFIQEGEKLFHDVWPR